MKPSCERCWKLIVNRRIWATRLALSKLGVSAIWLGLLDEKQRRSARHWKEHHKDDVGVMALNMLTTYQITDQVGLLATCNMLPNLDDTLVQMTLEEGLSVYYRWAMEYRPKRMTADWDLKLPGIFRGKFTASPHTINKMWKEMGERWGYKPGDVPEDTEAFERRMYLVIDEIRNPDKYK